MSDRPKIAVFGCGYWGKNHVRTLSELGALAAVVDQQDALATEMAQKFGVPALTDSEVFADTSIEGIVMALPAQHHAQMALRAFEAGKHVFAEKPIALSVSDAETMVEAADQSGKVLMAGHILRYHNAFRAIMNFIEEGGLGDVQYVQSHRLGFGKFHAKFDALWDLAPHDLSLLLSVVGREPESITPISTSVTSGQTDFSHVHLEFGSGVKGHIHVSRFSPYVERRFTVIGCKAMVVWDDMEPDWNKKVSVHPHNVSNSDAGGQFTKADPIYLDCEAGMALTDELEHFMLCMRTGKKPLTDGVQGLDVVKILNMAS